jgi:hypothetical protein
MYSRGIACDDALLIGVRLSDYRLLDAMRCIPNSGACQDCKESQDDKNDHYNLERAASTISCTRCWSRSRLL